MAQRKSGGCYDGGLPGGTVYLGDLGWDRDIGDIGVQTDESRRLDEKACLLMDEMEGTHIRGEPPEGA